MNDAGWLTVFLNFQKKKGFFFPLDFETLSVFLEKKALLFGKEGPSFSVRSFWFWHPPMRGFKIWLKKTGLLFQKEGASFPKRRKGFQNQGGKRSPSFFENLKKTVNYPASFMCLVMVKISFPKFENSDSVGMPTGTFKQLLAKNR